MCKTIGFNVSELPSEANELLKKYLENDQIILKLIKKRKTDEGSYYRMEFYLESTKPKTAILTEYVRLTWCVFESIPLFEKPSISAVLIEHISLHTIMEFIRLSPDFQSEINRFLRTLKNEEEE